MKRIEIFLKGGYTGGHCSNRNWNMDVEYNAQQVLKTNNILSDEWDNMGSTSGYYPSVIIDEVDLEASLSILSSSVLRTEVLSN